MNRKIPTLLTLLALSGTLAMAGDAVPLKTELPKPMLTGTPVPLNVENLEPARSGPRPDFMVPKGAVNLAKGAAVTASDNEPLLGELPMITDGSKDGAEGSFVELADGKQWVQIDLKKSAVINALVVWHFHSQARVYHDVVVQVSDDPDFITGVTTIYNNDHNNSAGLGKGTDKAYVDTYEGKIIDGKGAKGRYVRLYSAGNTANAQNHYIEVEVWGVPPA